MKGFLCDEGMGFLCENDRGRESSGSCVDRGKSESSRSSEDLDMRFVGSSGCFRIK